MIKERIKEHALSLGFDAVGFARADHVECENSFRQWLDNGYASEMHYMHNHFEKRCDPRLLVDNAKTIIVLALNYYPTEFMSADHPQFSFYAYGKDYHDVIKEKLRQLFEYINTEITPVTGRMFVDSAPVLERYWAVKAGLGFIGKNTQLIIPGKGSYFFLSELIIDIEIEPDSPVVKSCGSCTKCLDACPASAITPRCLDANKCISYQTIENKGDLSAHCIDNIGNHVYGCDVCQQVCPHNINAKGNNTPEFKLSDELKALDYNSLLNLSEERFRAIFKGSAVKRAGYKGLMRNVRALNIK